MADDGPEPPVSRGQPLKQFVENWEFRWDVQRDLYPWEWGQGGNLSDGPYNIIRYVPCLALGTTRSSLSQALSTQSHRPLAGTGSHHRKDGRNATSPETGMDNS